MRKKIVSKGPKGCLSSNKATPANKKKITQDRAVIDSRCVGSHFYDFFAKLNVCEDAKVMSELEATPFKHLLNFNKMKVDRGLLDALISKWDKDQVGFKLCGQVVNFSVRDVTLILGLRMNGQIVDWKCVRKYKSVLHESFQDIEGPVKRHQFKEVLEKIDRTKNDNNGSIFIRLFVLYLLCAVLFAKTNLTMDLSLAKYADEFNMLDKYDWASAVHQFLVKGINAAQKKMKTSKTVHLQGCAPVICVWAYEHISLWNNSCYTYPRLCNWGNGKNHRKRTYLEAFTKGSGVDVNMDIKVKFPLEHTFITPSNEECHLIGEVREEPSHEILFLRERIKELENIVSCQKEEIIALKSKLISVEMTTNNVVEDQRNTNCI